jgi:hypothetical protein
MRPRRFIHDNAGCDDGLRTTDHDRALALNGIARTGTGPAVAIVAGCDCRDLGLWRNGTYQLQR